MSMFADLVSLLVVSAYLVFILQTDAVNLQCHSKHSSQTSLLIKCYIPFSGPLAQSLIPILVMTFLDLFHKWSCNQTILVNFHLWCQLYYCISSNACTSDHILHSSVTHLFFCQNLYFVIFIIYVRAFFWHFWSYSS